MNAVLSQTNADLFGLFELDDSGTVLYSRSSGERAGESLVGRNFFEEVGVLENSADLHRIFKRFVHSHDALNSFDFDCLFENETVKAKILMSRAYETNLIPPAGFVILDIRKNSI